MAPRSTTITKYNKIYSTTTAQQQHNNSTTTAPQHHNYITTAQTSTSKIHQPSTPRHHPLCSVRRPRTDNRQPTTMDLQNTKPTHLHSSLHDSGWRMNQHSAHDTRPLTGRRREPTPPPHECVTFAECGRVCFFVWCAEPARAPVEEGAAPRAAGTLLEALVCSNESASAFSKSASWRGPRGPRTSLGGLALPPPSPPRPPDGSSLLPPRVRLMLLRHARSPPFALGRDDAAALCRAHSERARGALVMIPAYAATASRSRWPRDVASFAAAKKSNIASDRSWRAAVSKF